MGSYGKAAVGDISKIHGGDIAGHASHEVGLDVDLRLMTTTKSQCTTGVNRFSSSYSRTATRALLKALSASGRIKLVFFNDPVLMGKGSARCLRRSQPPPARARLRGRRELAPTADGCPGG